MSVSFHPLTVKEVIRETPDAVSVLLDIPEALKENFHFVSGQNLVLRRQFNGEELRRNYSICSAPHENVLRIAIRQIPGGIFSTWANTEMKAGDVLESMPPSGNFHQTTDAVPGKAFMAFAAGSGITPILSIIKSTLQADASTRFTLVYGNRNRQQIMFREELESIKNAYLSRFQLIHVLSREELEIPLHSGRIDADKCQLIHEKIAAMHNIDAFYLCGPEKMIFTVRDFLLGLSIPAARIHYELFHTDVQQTQRSVALQSALNTQSLSRVSIKLDGVVSQFDLDANGEPILLAALKQGINLPFACKGGMCCTCRAKLEEGTVEMDRNYALEADEIAAGFVLSCQSHPRSDRVVLNFDVR